MTIYAIAASAVTLGALSAPAAGQSMDMPGMTMPMPAKHHSGKAAPKKPAPHKAPAKKKAATKSAVAGKAKVENAPASGRQEPPTKDPMAGMAMPLAPQGPPTAAPMPGMDMSGGEHSSDIVVADMRMPSGALGPYVMNRESSGTAWQPDLSAHQGAMIMAGQWMLMAHGVVNFVYDHQSGPRGDDKAFASGMFMGMASRPLGDGTLQFKAMLSPDPLMGKSGYPLLLASGETANGTDRLIDRQHPHDLFMELSASVSQTIGAKSSVFLYAGLPGEPAFGPPAFMHREAIMDSPEAPISHHWLDSTHISFGVVSAGVVVGNIKAEVSRFNGREPDQHRWDIETGPLDSTAIRVSWNPTSSLALQGSWGHFTDPEQLEPGVDQKRWSASALYARQIARGWKLAGTLAWGRKTTHGHDDDAYVGEASLKHAGWTLFGRGEITENRELTNVANGPAHRVGKVSLGAVRDVRIADHFSLGAGGLFAVNFVPDALAPLYGGHNPTGAMAFVRLKLD